jgi:hypothetical protein
MGTLVGAMPAPTTIVEMPTVADRATPCGARVRGTCMNPPLLRAGLDVVQAARRHGRLQRGLVHAGLAVSTVTPTRTIDRKGES